MVTAKDLDKLVDQITEVSYKVSSLLNSEGLTFDQRLALQLVSAHLGTANSEAYCLAKRLELAAEAAVK